MFEQHRLEDWLYLFSVLFSTNLSTDFVIILPIKTAPFSPSNIFTFYPQENFFSVVTRENKKKVNFQKKQVTYCFYKLKKTIKTGNLFFAFLKKSTKSRELSKITHVCHWVSIDSLTQKKSLILFFQVFYQETYPQL